jgi:alkylation response protein AidB-like acyl-CoA dehydrogenase
VGSDAGAIETEAVPEGDGYRLHGRKKWTTYGQVADLFLVFAKADGKPVAFLVERDTPGPDGGAAARDHRDTRLHAGGIALRRPIVPRRTASRGRASGSRWRWRCWRWGG